MSRYSYSVRGTAAYDQTWEIAGTVESEPDFNQIYSLVMRESFMGLTNGKAVFGSPGRGCAGPYRITEMTIKCQTDSATGNGERPGGATSGNRAL